jgi:hypothetical protein
MNLIMSFIEKIKSSPNHMAYQRNMLIQSIKTYSLLENVNLISLSPYKLIPSSKIKQKHLKLE